VHGHHDLHCAATWEAAKKAANVNVLVNLDCIA
jgi:hypothetical protein